MTAPSSTPLLQIRDLGIRYGRGVPLLRPGRAVPLTVADVSFDVREGETLGIVGESGSGKTTVCKSIAGLVRAATGSIRFQGGEMVGRSPRSRRRIAREIQMVFQDPFGSLDPRSKIRDILREPLDVHHLYQTQERDQVIRELLGQVGMDDSATARYPHQLSGGQRQRIAIARALAVRPRLILADEPLSSLDVSVQAQISNLLLDLKQEMSLSFLLIAHNLAAVRTLSDNVAVMYRGRIVEIGPADSVYESPRHPYTLSLMSAVPNPDPAREATRTRLMVSPADDPKGENSGLDEAGCPYRRECWLYLALDRPDHCRTDRPDLTPAEEAGHSSACHYSANMEARPERQGVLETAGVLSRTCEGAQRGLNPDRS